MINKEEGCILDDGVAITSSLRSLCGTAGRAVLDETCSGDKDDSTVPTIGVMYHCVTWSDLM